LLFLGEIGRQTVREVRLPIALEKVDQVSKTLETVVAVGVSTRCEQDGSSALDAVLAEEGFMSVRGKTNLGLGRRA